MRYIHIKKGNEIKSVLLRCIIIEKSTFIINVDTYLTQKFRAIYFLDGSFNMSLYRFSIEVAAALLV